jgi:hypothetical protein
MDRRHFLTTALASALSPVLAQEKRAPRIVLRSSWQTVNIGDIAHTPGVLALLEKHYPEAEVRLWPSKVDNGAEEMLLQRFPKLTIIQGPEALKAAFTECDFLLHGSGPSLVAQKDVARWHQETAKPFGIYGITFSAQGSTSTKPASDGSLNTTIEVFNQAKFVFFRDSVSLALAKKLGATCPIMEFGPDGAFAVDLQDDAKADAFLKKHGLEEGKFLCCIPRLRFTPYWTLPEKKAKPDPVKHARNEAMKEHDCKPLRDAILAVLEATDLKILLCPEDKTQMAVNQEMLYDKLPADVKSARRLAEARLLAHRRSPQHLPPQRRPLRPRDAQPHHVHRQRHPRHRLPLGRANHERPHVARHRPRRLALRPGREADKKKVAPAVLAMAKDRPAAAEAAKPPKPVVREYSASHTDTPTFGASDGVAWYRKEDWHVESGAKPLFGEV